MIQSEILYIVFNYLKLHPINAWVSIDIKANFKGRKLVLIQNVS